MSSSYINSLIGYANTVQVYSPDGTRILNLLQHKVDTYSLLGKSSNRKDFWVEIEGLFLKKERYVELERLRSLEVSYKNYDAVYQLLTKSSSITKLSEWVRLLPKIESCVMDVTHFSKYLDSFKYKLEEGNFTCTSESLAFFNDAIEKQFNDKEMFKYLPLLIWSLENLYIYDKYSFEFNDYLKDNVLKYLKKHRQASNEFCDLINRESEYLNEIDNFGVINSSVFNELSSIEKDLTFSYKEDLNTDLFTSQLESFLNNTSKTAIDLDSAREVRRLNPLYCVYRAFDLASRLNCLDAWEYILPSKSVVLINRLVDVQTSTYSQENITYIILQNCKSILSLPKDSFERDISLWDLTAKDTLDLVGNLVNTGVLKVETALEIEEFLKAGREVIEVGSV